MRASRTIFPTISTVMVAPVDGVACVSKVADECIARWRLPCLALCGHVRDRLGFGPFVFLG